MTAANPPANTVANAGGSRRELWTGGQMPLVGGFLLLVGIAVGSIWLFVSSLNYAESVNHTVLARSKAYQVLTLVQDAETGQRGFLLSQDRNYLPPYVTGSGTALTALAELKTLAGSNKGELATLDRLDMLIRQKLAELASTLQPAMRGDFPAALVIVKSNSGNNTMTLIRDEIGRFQAEEARTQERLDAAARFADALLAVAMVVGIALIMALAALSVISSRRATAALLQSEQQLRFTNEHLEAIVAERVSELQMANEEIQRFAYIVSHDLRAPLVNVMGFTSELDTARTVIAGMLGEVEAAAPQALTPDRRAAIDVDLPEALNFIRASTAKMDRLINAILKLSREGRRVLTPQPIDLRELLEAQGQSLSQQLTEGAAKLEIQANLPDLVSDRLAVEQIFGNLLENATKYLCKGRPGRIEVTGQTQGAYARYEINDNGRGIEPKDFERIFELFRRSGEQDRPGEGIGLAYVRNLARRLGGNVTVRSEYGVGSTFIVMLPSSFQNKARAT